MLVVDADSAAGLETAQSLGRHGCIVHALALRPEHIRHRSRFIRKQIDASTVDDLGVRALVELFAAEKYDLVVPATEVALLALLSTQISGDLYQRAVLPPHTSLQTALNKQEIWTLARSLGIRIPSSEILSFESQPPDAFPVVLKPVFSKVSRGGAVRELSVTIARNAAQWMTAVEFTYRGVPVQQQQYIAGKGLGVEMLFEHGQPRWAFLHERVHELPLTGGGSSYRVSLELREELVKSATALLTALQWHGVAMVEFKIAANGDAFLIEINPRLWGSLALAIDCGVDFPLGLLCLATGQPLPPQPKYRTGYFTRNISRDIEWFKMNLKADRRDPLLLTRPPVSSMLEWLRPFLGKESWDFFCWSDLGVVLGECAALVHEQLRRISHATAVCLRLFYLRRLQQPLALRAMRRRRIHNVLVLCHGNICRSPLAAALVARRFPNLTVYSAGFHSTAGRPSPEFVLAAAGCLGVDLAGHSSRRVDAEKIGEADLVLIMDLRNRELLKQAYPGALSKTVLLGMLLPRPQLEIRDPYDDPASMNATASLMKSAVDRLGLLVG